MYPNRSARVTALAAAAALLVAFPSTAARAVDAPAGAAPPTLPVRPVPHVDLSSLQGLWYQTSAIPAAFEARCAEDVTARYTQLTDTTVQVDNNCLEADGSANVLIGAFQAADPGRNAELEVTFTQVDGVYVFPSTPNRVVIGLDPGYRWVVVGSDDHSAGFVLSRTPALTPWEQVETDLVEVLNGYDPSAFVPTIQDGATAAN
jgi:apolipoprotein D and lipocalin family protein